MELADNEPVLAPYREQVKLQGDIVRKLKASNASAADITDAVNELKIAKKQLEEKENSLIMGADILDENKLDQLIQCSSFYKQSFNLYGGVAGLYDYGWNGCGLKLNVLQYWRKFFVIEEDLLEIDCPVITPESVLKASGHVDRFSDYMVEDELTGNGFRLDHLIKSALEKLISKNSVTAETKEKCKSLLVKLDGFSLDEMKAVIKEFDIKDPINGNTLGEPKEVNLMFKTQIGLHRPLNTFLRPELAQGIFVNFKNLLSTFNVRIPFGACQVGNAYRNEISPRNGLVRVREFPLAEIEYFYDPLLPTYRKFSKIKNTELLLYSACNQMNGQSAVRITLEEAFKQGLIKNEILGYFLARIHLFLIAVGIDERKLRFRQHMKNEMAHYALDCWDAECLTNSGWLECVGCADRSAYDLTQHSKATGKRLTAQRSLSIPKEIDTVEIKCASNLIGKTFTNYAKKIFDFIHDLSGDDIFKFKNEIEKNGFYELTIGNKDFKIDSSMVEFKNIKKNVHVEEFTPSVIEPSFGIGRIIHSILEHKFRIRDDADKRMYFSIPPTIATYKCSVLPLTKKITLNQTGEKIVDTLCEELKSAGISTMLNDNSDTIGKRYTQMDQFGVPFGITVDFESLEKPHSVTLRERDSMTQVRVMLNEIVELLDNLVRNKIIWSDVLQKYPVV